METGKVIGGKYRLRREVGKGAMGSVWAAIHESLGRAVAVKFLRPSGVNPETAAARFVAEARMAAAVKHRFVVDIFDFGITEDGMSYMVLELLEGEELGERMFYGPPITVIEAVRFICQCLGGLAAVHGAGIVHRDLKPENIFMMQDADGQFPKLLDFGISKRNEVNGPVPLDGTSIRPPRMGGRATRTTRLTQPGTVIGTPWYMAPEQLRGRRDLDARADIYGIGVILWEWLTGRVPHDDDNIRDLVMKVMSSSPPDLMAVRPELGVKLSAVLQKAMAVRREDRYSSAQEMREALLEILPELPQTWTVVQKSIAHLSSEEVLGAASYGDGALVHPSMPPIPRGFLGRTSARLASTLPGFAPTVSSGLHSRFDPALHFFKKLVDPIWRFCETLYQRAPGYVVATGLSFFLLTSVAVFSSSQPASTEEVLKKSEALLTQTTSLSSANAQTDATLPIGEPPAPAETQQLVVGELTLLEKDGADASASEPASAPAIKKPTKAKIRAAAKRRRTRRKAKAKPKRLIRNLDF